MKKTIMILTAAFLTAFAQHNFSAILDKYINSPVEIDFEQKTYWHVREKESKFKGKIILGTSDKFNISVNRMTYVCDGKTFWEYDSRQKRVTVQKVLPGLSKSIPTELLKLLKNADFTENKQANSIIWQDKETVKNGYEKVEVFFAASQISKIITLDTEKNVTTYTFEKTAFLKSVSDNIFKFAIPQGVKVYED